MGHVARQSALDLRPRNPGHPAPRKLGTQAPAAPGQPWHSQAVRRSDRRLWNRAVRQQGNQPGQAGQEGQAGQAGQAARQSGLGADADRRRRERDLGVHRQMRNPDLRYANVPCSTQRWAVRLGFTLEIRTPPRPQRPEGCPRLRARGGKVGMILVMAEGATR